MRSILIATRKPLFMGDMYHHQRDRRWSSEDKKQWEDFFTNDTTWQSFFEKLPENMANDLLENLIDNIIKKMHKSLILGKLNQREIRTEIPRLFATTFKQHIDGEIPTTQFQQLVKKFNSEWDKLYHVENITKYHHGGRFKTHRRLTTRLKKRKTQKRRSTPTLKKRRLTLNKRKTKKV